jgi:hypothetical protein
VADGAAQPVGELLGGVRVDVGQEDGELFAAVAAQDVARAEGGGEAGGDGMDDVVAGRVAVVVVDSRWAEEVPRSWEWALSLVLERASYLMLSRLVGRQPSSPCRS